MQSIDGAPTSTHRYPRCRAALVAGWASVLLVLGLSLSIPTDATASGIGPHTSLDGISASVPLEAVANAVVAVKVGPHCRVCSFLPSPPPVVTA